MMYRSHAASGFAIGAGTLSLVPIHGALGQMCWIVACGGFALVPDLDHPQATISRMWGPISYVVSVAVAKLSGGHRGWTHTLVGALVAGILAAAAMRTFWGAVAVAAIADGLALRACAFLIPGHAEESWLINLPVSWFVAYKLVESGERGLWLPAAVVLGCLVHTAGDWLTKGKIHWLRPIGPATSLGLFRTGKLAERYAVFPLLMLATAALLWHNTISTGF